MKPLCSFMRRPRHIGMLALTLLLAPLSAGFAADSYWSNTGGGSFNNGANWLGGVPGTGDNASFTNNASYAITWSADATTSNAFFNAQSGTVTLSVSPQTWSLLDQFVIGQSGATGSVSHSSGTIVITNAVGLGALVIGEAGRGTYTLAGGTVTADRLFATNVTATATNSFFQFNGGTLTTLAGSEVRASMMQDEVSTIVIGSTATPAVWNMLGGSNTISTTALKLGRLSDGNRILVSGPTTVLDVSGGSFQIGEVGSRNQLVVSNGARVNMTFSGSGAIIGVSGGAQSNSVVVTGSNSLWDVAGELLIGRSSGRDEMVISNGGEVRSSNGKMGEGSGAHSNNVTVTGAGSRWGMSGTLLVGFYGKSNLLTIANGGVVSNAAGAETRVGTTSGSTDNRVVITGAGSMLQTPNLYVGNNSVSSGSGIVVIQDGGTLEANYIHSGTIVGGAPSGVISNNGGVYQFTYLDPGIRTNSPNSIVLNNGTISFRGINNANVFANVNGSGYELAKMTFQGNNAFRLNNASNATGVATYTFDTGRGATNYTRLELDNGGRWRSTTLLIGSGGSLAGNGTVESASVTNLGTIAPGFSAGELTFTSNLVLGSSSTLQMEIGGTNAVDYDRLIVAGNLSLTGALHVTTLNGFAAPTGTVFTLIDGASPSIGQFIGLTNSAFIDASSSFFTIEYNYNGNDVVLIATIPEPSTLAFLTIAATLLTCRRR